ncbi:CsgG/HfaB family protein [Sphingomonas sp. MMS24-J13]|uniref:CsgG/HfaB family protein n=1 Tax=Sphingomonas sp. MMS24-J13 TaxID=3238686 RepID=UPI00384FB02D
MKFGLALFAISVVSGATVAGAEPKLAKASSGQQLQEQTMNDVPHCTRKLGTVSVADGDDPSRWTQYQLAPPSKLLKVLITRSGCFNLVDRGTGLNAAEREREIGSNLGLQRRSNVGQGQIKAADYVLVAEIQGANSNVSGGGVGAAAGALLGGSLGALAGGLRSKKMEANTILSLTNVRTTETIATEDGYAAKKNMAFVAGGGVGFFGGGAAAVGGGYDNTDIGRMVTLSFIQAYSKMVTSLNLVQPGATGTAEAAPSKTFTATAPLVMHKTPLATGAAVRTLPPGSIVYPTGNKNGLWWEVADENDNVGWVLNTKLAPSN